MQRMPTNARSILCVTHQSEFRSTLENALTGFQLTFAVKAVEAIALSNTRRFDAFVFDFWFADWSGVSLCRHVRKDDPHVPVILCNAADDHARNRALRAGARAVFDAPIDGDALCASLDKLISAADIQNVSAKCAANDAVHQELMRQVQVLQEQTKDTRQTAARANERILRVKGMRTFIENGGTRSQFDRWWPDICAEFQQAS